LDLKSNQGAYKGATEEQSREDIVVAEEKTLLLRESTGLLQEHFGTHRGAEIDYASMVITRNHDN